MSAPVNPSAFGVVGRRQFRATTSTGTTPMFLPPVVYDSGGDQPAYVIAADVNGDGKLDLLVANSYFDNTIGVRLGNGDGTFGSLATFPSGGGFPTGIVAVDIDGDGKTDLVVFNQTPCYACSGNGSVAILHGNGDGTFASPQTYDSGGGGYGAIGPSPMSVVDVNGDGKLDIVIANCSIVGGNCGDGDGEVGILLGNGDGTFQDVVVYDTGVNPGGNGLAVGDLNGDGKPDIVVTVSCDSSGCGVGSMGVLLGNGDGTFQPIVKYALASFSALGIAVADLNHDGKLDVIVGGCLSAVCIGQEGAVTVLLGKGDGTFNPPVAYGTGSGFADGVTVADVNGDGNPDIIVMNWDDGSLGLLQGKGDGTFLTAITVASGLTGSDYGVGVADINGDGRPDLLGTGYPDAVGVLINATPFNPTQTKLVSSLNPATYGHTVRFGITVGPYQESPTGKVVLFEGTRALGSATLVNRKARISISSLSAGIHLLTAAFQGSGWFAPSTSLALRQGVTMASTSIALTSSSNPTALGQTVTYTTKVASRYGGRVNGTVIFRDGSTSVATVPLVHNQAAYVTSYSKPGMHSIAAIYSGDANHTGSKSARLIEVAK